MQNVKAGKRKWPIVLAVLAAAAAIYIYTSLWISTNLLTVRQFEADFGTGSEVRAVVISDLHNHSFGGGNHELAEKIRGAPVYYALGNHELEYMAAGHPELEEELEAAGAVVLDKEYTDIEINGMQIRLGGMYDYAFGLNGDNDALAAPEDTLTFLQDFQDTDRIKVMLSHRPDSFIFGDASKVWDVDLVISGHNHGGQVVIPFLGGLFGGDQGWFPEYVHGMNEKDGIRIFETAGLGSDRQKLPRFNNPPEIAVLTIK